MDVVLVHGLFDNGSHFKHLVRSLQEHGHRCWIPALKPADGRTGVHDMSIQLKTFIDKHIKADVQIAIIGFSMGCIVSRQYLQVLGGASRTKAFFAISGPHKGTLTAYLHIGQGAKDMRPGSELLNHLKQTEECLRQVHLFAYWTSRDINIIPASSCHWHLASNCLDAKVILHRFMPKDRRVCIDIVHRISTLQHTLNSKAKQLPHDV
jgi:triacylglycerol lipase